MTHHKKLLAISVAAAVSSQSGFASTDEDSRTEAEKDSRISEEVLVTGSRIARSTFAATSPTTVINAEEIKMTGEQNLNEILSTMPQFGPGFDATDGSYSFGNAGLNVLDLRDLGTLRTLTLINGHRPIQAATDFNTMVTEIGMIPSELVERIEVMTGGASAVYGADAVAGVTNFILKDNFEGTSVRTQVGDSDNGGAGNKAFTVTHGFNFANDRANLVVSMDYFEQDALFFRDRPGSGGTTRYVNNPENTGPDDGIFDKQIFNGVGYPDFNITGNTFGVWNTASGGLDWFNFNQDGTSTLRTPATSIVDGWQVIDGSGHDPIAYNMARSPYERTNGYARFSYELSEATQLTADLMYSKTESYDEIDPHFYKTWITLSGLSDAGITVPDSVQSVYWVITVRAGSEWRIPLTKQAPGFIPMTENFCPPA